MTMHQSTMDCEHQQGAPLAYGGRCTRPRSACASGGSGGGAERCSSSGSCSLGLAVLTSDPLLELVYRTGMVSLKDLRALRRCTGSEAIHEVAKERARDTLTAAAASLRSMRGAFELCAARVRVLALDAEGRLLQLGVPMNAVHPELSSPLKEGGAAHHALYAGLITLGQVLRSASHPVSWAEQPASMWDALAASTGISMRPQLVLVLSTLLPVEARMSYLALRHAAYSGPGVSDLGGLVKAVLLRMMLYCYGPMDVRRISKQLKQVASRLSPFSFWLLRQCAAGSAACGMTLAQQQQWRAEAEESLSAQIDRLFCQHEEQVLYSSQAWVGWLHGLPTQHLVALYVKYLYDGFQ